MCVYTAGTIGKVQVFQQQARPGGDVTDGPHKPVDLASAHFNVKDNVGAWKCVDVQNWLIRIGLLAKFAKRLVG